jgi:hypothetical protein
MGQKRAKRARHEPQATISTFFFNTAQIAVGQALTPLL